MHLSSSALVLATAALISAKPIARADSKTVSSPSKESSFRVRPRVQKGFPRLVARNGTGGAVPINSGAVSLIENLEGFNPNFYTIDGDTTIGYGHDCTQIGGCDDLSAPISQQEGEDLLMSDLGSYESCVCSLSNASGLNSNQYGALVSFTYNSGCGGVQEYFGSYMDDSNFSGICEALPTTNTLDGELSSRRQQEGDFCSQATSDPSGC